MGAIEETSKGNQFWLFVSLDNKGKGRKKRTGNLSEDVVIVKVMWIWGGLAEIVRGL